MEVVKPGQFDLQRWLSSFKLNIWIVVVVALGIYLLTGIYIVGPEEQGVVRRFGKKVRVVGPGPHYRLPWPIEQVDTPKVTEIKRIEIGFRTIYTGPPARYEDVPQESLMLTGDENIVDAEVIVQYKIKDAGDYLFNVKDPEGTLRDAAEASIRLVIGQNTIERVLTVGKHEIQEQIATMLQDVMDRYDSGILITAVKLQDVSAPKPVIAAFKDVASAREDKNRLINQAKGYQEDVIPKARGEAERIIREAEAYKEKRIREAEGEAARFRKILQEYRKAKLVTKKRLYLETMEGILPHIRKVVIDKRSGNILNLLPIDKILSKELGGETR